MKLKADRAGEMPGYKVVKNSGCSSGGPRLYSQLPHGGSRPSIIPVKGIWCPFLASTGMWYIHVGRENTPT